MKELFDEFVKEKTFLNNVTPKTIRFYTQSFNAFTRSGGTLDEQGIKTFVINLRQTGISPVTCNVYIRGVNSFLSWLRENKGYPKLRIKQLKEEKKVIQTFTEAQLKAIVMYKPASKVEKRCHAILILLIDTGIRIEEALTLRRGSVDFDNLLVTVKGKGNKERIVPISVECRKSLYKFLRSHSFDSVFPVYGGGRLEYHNFLRDMKAMCAKIGITGVRVSPHTLRHTFAKNYVRSGGNLFYLQTLLGHTTLQMTKRYVEVETEALSAMHLKTGLLSRLH